MTEDSVMMPAWYALLPLLALMCAFFWWDVDVGAPPCGRPGQAQGPAPTGAR